MKKHAPTTTEIIAILLIMLTVGLLMLFLEATGKLKANAAPAFDHSQCQYPERTTNPPDGCDNSDPANPYCAVKGLPEDCKEPEQPVQNTSPTPNTTELEPKKEEVSQCGK
jgi:hypothetical protein